MKINLIDPVHWHRGAIQTLHKENATKRGLCGVLLVKKPLQASLNCVAAATGVAALARELFVLMGKGCLGMVKLATLPVRLVKSARAHHDKLPGFTSCARTARRIGGQTVGFFASLLGTALFLYKGSELNVRAQKALGNVREIILNKKPEVSKIVPKAISAAANAAAAARQAIVHLAAKLEGSTFVQESQKWASKQVIAFLSIVPGNGGNPIVAAFPTGPAHNGQAMVASIPMGAHGTATLTLVPLDGFKPVKANKASPQPSPRKLSSPRPSPDVSQPRVVPQPVIQQQKPPQQNAAGQKPKATPKSQPKLMGGAAAQFADQVAAAARNKDKLLKPIPKPPPPPPPPPV